MAIPGPSRGIPVKEGTGVSLDAVSFGGIKGMRVASCTRLVAIVDSTGALSANSCQHHSRRTDRKRALTPGQVRFQLERIHESCWMSSVHERR